MAKGYSNGDRVTKWICWIGRIWSLPIIAYALLLVVGYAWNWLTRGVADPYAVEDYSRAEALPPILMLVSVLGLGIAWHWERLGAITVIVFQLAALSFILVQSPFTQDFPRLVFPYLLWMIVTIPGLLFLVCWWRSNRQQSL
jgi:hypothetical protein